MTQAIQSPVRQPSPVRRTSTLTGEYSNGDTHSRGDTSAAIADASQSATVLADQSIIAAIARDGHLAMLSRQSSGSIAAAEAAGSTPQSGGEDAALQSITRQFQQRFRQQAGDKAAFHDLMRQSFGDTYDRQAAEAIRQRVLSGDFSWMPKVELVDSTNLQDVSGLQGGGIGKGAYSAGSDTIYLSRELLASNPAEAERILTEEVGHALDTRVNVSDAAGDEGEIFSRLSHGEKLSASDIAAARAENDSGTIIVDGQRVEVEFGLLKSIKKGVKKCRQGDQERREECRQGDKKRCQQRRQYRQERLQGDYAELVHRQHHEHRSIHTHPGRAGRGASLQHGPCCVLGVPGCQAR